MQLKQLLHGFAEVPEAQDVTVRGLSIDSRALQAGEVFCALQGAQSHGLQYLQKVRARGASAVLWEPSAEFPAVQGVKASNEICVPGLREKLGHIARRYYFADSEVPKVIGVTGTNGKTSSVLLLAQLLSALGQATATIGTLGTGFPSQLQAGTHTTPDAIAVQRAVYQLQGAGAKKIAMEVSSHALAQSRVNGVEFELAVFTNLSRDHLDYHGDMEAYFAAKMQLFGWPTLRAAVVNIDDAFGARLADMLPTTLRCVRIGLHANADLRASDLELTSGGMQFFVGSERIRCGLIGRFNAYNLLGAIACAMELGWPLTQIAPACAALSPVPGRMNVYGGDAQPMVVVDYAHTPDGLQQALLAVREHAAGKVICVFGCGGDRDRGKRPLMGAIAKALADVAIVTSDNPRSEAPDAIIAEVLTGNDGLHVEPDRGRAIRMAIAMASTKDVVLVAGKGHENYQEVSGVKRPFNDALIVQQALVDVVQVKAQVQAQAQDQTQAQTQACSL
jgi:UDP-N-acetylmuramoyl-L-alanyl-D-glutamate--2,6-diaminopimelate ligase